MPPRRSASGQRQQSLLSFRLPHESRPLRRSPGGTGHRCADGAKPEPLPCSQRGVGEANQGGQSLASPLEWLYHSDLPSADRATSKPRKSLISFTRNLAALLLCAIGQ